VPFKELDNQRVLGQHSEVHALGTLYARGGTWGTSVVPAEVWPTLLWDVHSDVVEEMAKRWGKTDPVEYIAKHSTIWRYRELRVEYRLRDFIGPEQLEKDRWNLVCRWNGKYRGRGQMPGQYEPLLERFWTEGCTHEGEEKISGGGVLCYSCKQYVRLDGQWLTAGEYRRIVAEVPPPAGHVEGD